MEISIAVQYILSHLYTKLPRRRVDCFGEELEQYLHVKFQHHWYPNDPVRDAPFRCLNVVGPQVDLLFPEAAAVSGLEWSEIQACLPEGLVISIDPGHVACQYHQPAQGGPEFNRFNSSSSLLSNAPLSLSSSGCSSASSSISSTNVTPNATNVTHQVLYSVQDSWLTYAQGLDEKNTDEKIQHEFWSEVDHNDNLATATALSVLAETDDAATLEASQEHNKSKTIWDKNVNAGTHHEVCAMPSNLDAGFHDSDQTKVDGRNIVLDAKNLNDDGDWNNPNSSADHAILSLLNLEHLGYPTALLQNMNPAERAHLLSLLNKVVSRQYQFNDRFSNTQDVSVFGSTNNCASTFLQPPKYDVANMQPRFNPLVGQSLSVLNATNHFVQKSTSTPSFTAATFAQTKFGSTKLKSHSKRTPQRILSPSDLPQSFAYAKMNNNLAQRESVVAALIHGNNSQRAGFVPSLEANGLGELSKKTSIFDESTGFPPDGNVKSVASFGRGTLEQDYNIVSLQQRLQIRSQQSTMDAFLGDQASGDADRQVMGKCNFNDSFEAGIHGNLGTYWQPGSTHVQGGSQGLLNEADWLHVNFPKFTEQKPTPSPQPQNDPTRTTDAVNVDALLSTQMVNLLLDDGNMPKEVKADYRPQNVCTAHANTDPPVETNDAALRHQPNTDSILGRKVEIA